MTTAALKNLARTGGHQARRALLTSRLLQDEKRLTVVCQSSTTERRASRFDLDGSGRPATWDSFGIWDNRIDEPILLPPSIKYGKPIPKVNLSKVGCTSHIGKRKENEDRFDYAQLTDNVLYFAVYDGHGGVAVAEFCNKHMREYIHVCACLRGLIRRGECSAVPTAAFSAVPETDWPMVPAVPFMWRKMASSSEIGLSSSLPKDTPDSPPKAESVDSPPKPESPDSPPKSWTPKIERQRLKPKRRLHPHMHHGPMGFSMPLCPLNTPSRKPSSAPKKPPKPALHAEETLFWSDSDDGYDHGSPPPKRRVLRRYVSSDSDSDLTSGSNKENAAPDTEEFLNTAKDLPPKVTPKSPRRKRWALRRYVSSDSDSDLASGSNKDNAAPESEESSNTELPHKTLSRLLHIDLPEIKGRKKQYMKNIVHTTVAVIIKYYISSYQKQSCDGCQNNLENQESHSCITSTVASISRLLRSLCAKICYKTVIHTVILIAYCCNSLILTAENINEILTLVSKISKAEKPYSFLKKMLRQTDPLLFQNIYSVVTARNVSEFIK